ncbi:MAG: hypothetical protein ACM3PT_00750 [Deltaproteobacteria bacterium]
MNFLIFVDWWNSLSTAQQVFWTIAVIFSVLFILQVISSILGLEYDTHADINFHVDSQDGHFDVDQGFTLFSVRSIIAFFTFFGWVGVITLSKGLDIKYVLIISLIAGLIAMVFVAFVLFQLIKLAETGTIDIEEMLGKYGKVYVTIPEKRSGTGLVNIEMKNKIMELRAVTDGEKLPSGTVIYVFKVLDDNILLVGEISENKN